MKDASVVSSGYVAVDKKYLEPTLLEDFRHLSIGAASSKMSLRQEQASAISAPFEQGCFGESLPRFDNASNSERAEGVLSPAKDEQQSLCTQKPRSLFTSLAAPEAVAVSSNLGIHSLLSTSAAEDMSPGLPENLFEACSFEALSSSVLSPRKHDAAPRTNKNGISVSLGSMFDGASSTTTSASIRPTSLQSSVVVSSECSGKVSGSSSHNGSCQKVGHEVASPPQKAVSANNLTPSDLLSRTACHQEAGVMRLSCEEQAVTRELREAERQRDSLAKALETAEVRESMAAAQARRSEVGEERVRSELCESRSVTAAAEAEAAAQKMDVDEARRILLDILASERSTSAGEDSIAARRSVSLARLAGEVADVCRARREEAEPPKEARASVACAGPQHLRAARETLAIGTKLWRLQQAQRALQGGGALPVPVVGNGASRGRGRPLYALPPAKKAGDDIAAQLLTEMSQALRELEDGISH
jgi:hypothetical protein